MGMTFYVKKIYRVVVIYVHRINRISHKRRLILLFARSIVIHKNLKYTFKIFKIQVNLYCIVYKR